MNPEEIISKIITLLNLELEHRFRVLGGEPWKEQLFQLCREAYRNGYFNLASSPLLTGDALRDILVLRWQSGDEQEKLIEQLCDMWDEWRYALEHYDR